MRTSFISFLRGLCCVLWQASCFSASLAFGGCRGAPLAHVCMGSNGKELTGRRKLRQDNNMNGSWLPLFPFICVCFVHTSVCQFTIQANASYAQASQPPPTQTTHSSIRRHWTECGHWKVLPLISKDGGGALVHRNVIWMWSIMTTWDDNKGSREAAFIIMHDYVI